MEIRFKTITLSWVMPCIFESAQSRMGPDALEQSSKAGIGKTIFCKGPGSKYFRFCEPYGLYHNYSTLPLWHESSHKQHIDEQRYLSSNKTLFTKRSSGLDFFHRPARANSCPEMFPKYCQTLVAIKKVWTPAFLCLARLLAMPPNLSCHWHLTLFGFFLLFMAKPVALNPWQFTG